MNAQPGASRHLSVHVDRPAGAVYAYASDPAHLPAWAHGLGTTIRRVAGRWVADSSPMGRVEVAFTPRNELGVLDHDVTLPSGETVFNPVRVIPDGAGSEVVFTLRRRPGMSEAEFRRDAGMVAADLARLKERVESAAAAGSAAPSRPGGGGGGPSGR
ncbi:SRPBCC family protein [Streptomyces hoynatensis]|uniref:SRPBCC family protein n=1 Tax=Streptomyces hoynatensis TaxID=1141874 RepID=A0A3A9Z9H1_9ACTN|nr:SRPBCC family protein [Streptomyces hoynatensis]RKN45001.1 SRPBCC family protein [Streptomyces hoynatensis]